MNDNEEITPEFKTIRVSASNYYKLVELTGIISSVSGYNFSLTSMADMAIMAVHESWYQKYLQIATDPKQLPKARQELQANLQHVFDLFKNVKIKK